MSFLIKLESDFFCQSDQRRNLLWISIATFRGPGEDTIKQ